MKNIFHYIRYNTWEHHRSFKPLVISNGTFEITQVSDTDKEMEISNGIKGTSPLMIPIIGGGIPYDPH